MLPSGTAEQTAVFSPITTHIGFLERAGALRPAGITAGLEGRDPYAQTVLLLLRQLSDLRAPPRSMAIHVMAAELTEPCSVTH